MNGTVQAIIRANDGTVRPFSTINVDDVDAALADIQALASTTPAAPAAAPTAATTTDAPPAPPAPIADQPAAAPAPAPIADQAAVQAPTVDSVNDRVTSLESRVAALEQPK